MTYYVLKMQKHEKSSHVKIKYKVKKSLYNKDKVIKKFLPQQTFLQSWDFMPF